jgi:DNA-binding XRE family transcriptional regulator
MFHKIHAVQPLPAMQLMLWFTGGVIKQYNVKPLLAKWKQFSILQDDQLFNRVKVDAGGYGISWNDEIDLACNELWENGFSADPVEIQRIQFIESVINARRHSGMSQKELENTSGIKQPVIARLERGDTNPQLLTLLRILSPLGKTIKVVDLE